VDNALCVAGFGACKMFMCLTHVLSYYFKHLVAGMLNCTVMNVSYFYFCAFCIFLGLVAIIIKWWSIGLHTRIWSAKRLWGFHLYNFWNSSDLCCFFFC